MANRIELSPIVYVIDDEPMMREALDSLLRSFNFRVRCFSSIRDFRLHRRDAAPSCLVLDVRMPEEDGLSFQRRLAASGDTMPIIFLTGHGDVPMAVQAMRHGAVEFLLKPFKAEDLIRAVQTALTHEGDRRGGGIATQQERTLYESLSQRDRRIVNGVVAGKLNKQIAAELGLKEITIKVLRAQIMRTLEIDKTAALIALVHRLASRPYPSPSAMSDL